MKEEILEYIQRHDEEINSLVDEYKKIDIVTKSKVIDIVISILSKRNKKDNFSRLRKKIYNAISTEICRHIEEGDTTILQKLDVTSLENFIEEVRKIHLIQKLESIHYDIILSNVKELYIACENFTSGLSKIDEEVIDISTIKDRNLKKILTSYCRLNNFDWLDSHTQLCYYDDVQLCDTEKMYLKEIKKIPLLNKEEEYNLAGKAKQGDIEARNQLVEHNLRLVVSIAKRYANRGVPFLDLIQEGSLGLMNAIDKFDPNKGYRLSSFATWHIREAMITIVGKANCDIELKQYQSHLRNRFYILQSQLEYQKGREVTDDEVIASMNLNCEQIKWIKNILSESLSLDASLNSNIFPEKDGVPLKDILKSQLSVEEEVLEKIGLEDFKKSFQCLTTREQEVLNMIFGLEDGIQYSDSEIGKKYNVTKQAIHGTKKKALIKLRRNRYIQSLRKESKI